MTTHSPLPWEGCNAECSCGQVWSIPGDFPVCTATKTGCVVHEHMADAPDIIYQSISPELKQANAAFIVKAVNAHDELVAALKAYVCGTTDMELAINFKEHTRALLTRLGELEGEKQ